MKRSWLVALGFTWVVAGGSIAHAQTGNQPAQQVRDPFGYRFFYGSVPMAGPNFRQYDPNYLNYYRFNTVVRPYPYHLDYYRNRYSNGSDANGGYSNGGYRTNYQNSLYGAPVDQGYEPNADQAADGAAAGVPAGRVPAGSVPGGSVPGSSGGAAGLPSAGYPGAPPAGQPGSYPSPAAPYGLGSGSIQAAPGIGPQGLPSRYSSFGRPGTPPLRNYDGAYYW